jgi:hypothetical protein
MVPEPQKGSRRGEAVFQPEANSIPAATVSLRGALAVARRYPRRWRREPDESALTVQ